MLQFSFENRIKGEKSAVKYEEYSALLFTFSRRQSSVRAGAGGKQSRQCSGSFLQLLLLLLGQNRREGANVMTEGK